jgi:hypothetical protein
MLIVNIYSILQGCLKINAKWTNEELLLAVQGLLFTINMQSFYIFDFYHKIKYVFMSNYIKQVSAIQ